MRLHIVAFVSSIKNQGALSTAQLKRIEKIDDLLDRREKKFSNDGRFCFRNRKVDQTSQRNTFQTSKPFQKKSPEEYLEEAIKQTRAGQCTHCTEEGHFYRECPTFWEKVRQSRAAQKK